MKSLPKRMSSSVMMLETEDGKILTVKSGYKPYWTLPGGIVDPNETPKESAIRETLEEVGIRIDPSTVTFVAVVNRRSEFAETYQFIFKASLSNSAIKTISLQASEINEYDLVTKQQVSAKDRRYAKALDHWVNGIIGYIEQTFEGGKQ
jgi:8-oxo-dGTP diphosphatase